MHVLGSGRYERRKGGTRRPILLGGPSRMNFLRDLSPATKVKISGVLFALGMIMAVVPSLISSEDAVNRKGLLILAGIDAVVLAYMIYSLNQLFKDPTEADKVADETFITKLMLTLGVLLVGTALLFTLYEAVTGKSSAATQVGGRRRRRTSK